MNVFIQRKDQRVTAIAYMISVIIFLNYFSLYTFGYERALYRILFYLPLALGTLWFSLKGAIVISVTSLILYLPCGIQLWDGSSIEDFYIICEALVFMFIALIFGVQVQRAENERSALIKAERLSAIGRTVVEVAHDMRAPLVAIGGFSAQVARDLGKREADNRKKLDIVIKQATRLDGMVREMLDFGKDIELHYIETSLNDLVSEAAKVAQQAASDNGVKLTLDLAPSLPLMSLDPNRLIQVILNLITNAIQASSEGDRVKISTYVGDQWNIALDVVDAGCGIKKKDEDKIFLPFYTTKREGTGLGLPIVRKIVEAHSGSLRFYSNKGKGVTFHVQLPLISGSRG